MCYNMHSDSRFKSPLNRNHEPHNRLPTHWSVYHNTSNIFMQNILLLRDRNSTHASQEWGQNTLMMTLTDDAFKCYLQALKFELSNCRGFLMLFYSLVIITTVLVMLWLFLLIKLLGTTSCYCRNKMCITHVSDALSPNCNRVGCVTCCRHTLQIHNAPPPFKKKKKQHPSSTYPWICICK